ncbi:unnamed protein product [Pleuronectes platessa]|uniref:Uncharacterized protein n=1 Tax=Pleuronectes platessa TaxID=8262 RepID=A0A9N7VDB0_PLEPL|nr:unnamed protein product [Pleuronectes platessa]
MATEPGSIKFELMSDERSDPWNQCSHDASAHCRSSLDLVQAEMLDCGTLDLLPPQTPRSPASSNAGVDMLSPLHPQVRPGKWPVCSPQKPRLSRSRVKQNGLKQVERRN